MALTFTQADLDALKAALLTGATQVRIGDRTIVYRSQDELIDAIRMVEAYLSGISADVADNPNIVQATYSKGAK